VEALDFGEIFAPVARLEAMRILLALATSKGFKIYQMDVKNCFLNGVIQDEIFVRQPPGFKNTMCDNTSAISIGKNLVFHKRMRHLERRYHQCHLYR
jgi:hypothetical protein